MLKEQQLNRFFFLLILSVMPAGLLFSAEFNAEIHYRILNITEAQEPQIFNEVLMFSYQGAPRTLAVSLAFEHEEYQIFHTYTRNSHGVFILTIPAPARVEDLRYRLIVDGLWTPDPMLPLTYDKRGIPLSSFPLPRLSMPSLETEKILAHERPMRFFYKGKEGAQVSLVGDFNQWDPYLTPMQESELHAGQYETVIILTKGPHYYRYVVDGQEILDPQNQQRARNTWGEDASLVSVSFYP